MLVGTTKIKTFVRISRTHESAILAIVVEKLQPFAWRIVTQVLHRSLATGGSPFKVIQKIAAFLDELGHVASTGFITHTSRDKDESTQASISYL